MATIQQKYYIFLFPNACVLRYFWFCRRFFFGVSANYGVCKTIFTRAWRNVQERTPPHQPTEIVFGSKKNPTTVRRRKIKAQKPFKPIDCTLCLVFRPFRSKYATATHFHIIIVMFVFCLCTVYVIKQIALRNRLMQEMKLQLHYFSQLKDAEAHQTHTSTNHAQECNCNTVRKRQRTTQKRNRLNTTHVRIK